MMIRVEHGDCRTVMLDLLLEGVQVDAIVTDPPYHLTQNSRGGSPRTNDPTKPFGRHRIGDKGFMGMVWDGGEGVAFQTEIWQLAHRLLKPGGHLLAFGGTRTYHRLACAIEDAGFEIRDQVGWLYASGFPKSVNVSKHLDKLAGAEREVLAEGRPVRRIIPGADQNATGSWVKDNGRIYIPQVTAPATDMARRYEGWGTALKPAWEPICVARKPLIGTVAENVLAHGTGAINIDACRVPSEGGKHREGEASQNRRYTDEGGTNFAMKPGPRGGSPEGRWPANILTDGNLTESWSRYFFSAKAGKTDRAGSKHPTIKPVNLIEYLAKLISPPGGLILDPFAGSGTLATAAHRLGLDAILIEREAAYIKDIDARIAGLRPCP